jgi:hypothetical protein
LRDTFELNLNFFKVFNLAPAIRIRELELNAANKKYLVCCWMIFSADTALRDLQDLVKKGVLEIEGSGRGTSYKIKDVYCLFIFFQCSCYMNNPHQKLKLFILHIAICDIALE